MPWIKSLTQLTKRDETPIEEKVEGMRKVVDAYDDLENEIKQTSEKYQEIINSDLTEEEQKEAIEEIIKDDHDARLEISNQVINDMIRTNLTDEEILDKYDDNNDGFIDAEEAKDTGLSQEEIDRINSQKQSIMENEYLSPSKKRKLLGKL